MKPLLVCLCFIVGSLAKSVTDQLSYDDLMDKLAHGPRQKSMDVERQTTGIDWMLRGQQELNQSLATVFRNNTAKNVILFIGDGMGVTTLTAARIYIEHKSGRSMTEGQLSWEDFPHTALVKTYNTDQQTPDSAGTATAFTTGYKTSSGVISGDETVILGNCDSMTNTTKLRSFLHIAQDEGMWSGVVSTARITHATPACGYANAASRNWEADSDIPLADRGKCTDIAHQLVNNPDNQNLRVILGGGRKTFMPSTTTDPEYSTWTGDRLDNTDLRQTWKDIKINAGYVEGRDFAYVEQESEFDLVDEDSIQYLMGLFEPSHMKYEADRADEAGTVWTEPSLAEMVEKSIKVLNRSPNGYALFVEGGRIDHANHDTNAYRALSDVEALHEAVQKAKDMTSESDTLIVVTADHSHVLTIAGYQDLDKNILDQTGEIADDGKPYTTLGYNNGPGFEYHRNNGTHDTLRKDITGDITIGRDYQQDAHIDLYSETHGGEDVPVYARGPMSHLFSGQHEQNYIAHAIMYATCIGPNKGQCT